MFVFALAACSAPASGPEAKVIRVGYSGEPDFGELPSVVAHDRLEAIGYRIEVTHFAAPDVAIEAVSRHTVDVAHATMIGAWKAVARGAPVRTIINYLANPYRLVVSSDVKTCADLDGRRLAVSAASAVSTHMVHAFIGEACPNVKPQLMSIFESGNRTAGLLSGNISAAAVELNTMLWLFSQAPGRFSVLSDFSTRWPGIRATGVHANTTFIAEHPDAVRDYTRTMLAVIRELVRDPSMLVPKAEQELGRTEDWNAVARAYVAENVWLADSGLSAEDVNDTLTFFKTYSQLDPELLPGDVADLRFLEEALADSER